MRLPIHYLVWNQNVLRLTALILFAGTSIGLHEPAAAQDSAPSSHLVFDDGFDGDIIINQVRVPSGGDTLYTYYETLGWRGKGAGYAGIQVHPKAHLYIFSIWDHKDHKAPIKAVYHGPGTETVGFGGEGTGLKSWNFDLGWDTDNWYTLVARTWPVDDHTYYGFWACSNTTGQWTHMVTMDVAVENARFRGGTDAFIEDWSNTGKEKRVSHLKDGWKRKMDGTWFPFGKARYSVNAWDLVEGKRSFHFRNNWDGGASKDENDSYYFMESGGATTQPTTENPSSHSIDRHETEPKIPRIRVESVVGSVADEKLEVRWSVDKQAAPQFGYEVALLATMASAEPIVVQKNNVPHARSVSFDLSKFRANPRFVRVRCTDILGRTGEAITVASVRELTDAN